MKILISGICGFAGSRLARSLRAADETLSLMGFDNFSRPGSELNRRLLKEEDIAVFHADLRHSSDTDALPAADWIIDAAANPSVLAGLEGGAAARALVENNLFGTVNLLEYCRRHRAGFILISTSRVYSIKALAALELTTRDGAFCLEPGREQPAGVTGEGVSESFSTRAPISLYGSSKLASEQLAIEYGACYDFPVWINRCGVLAGPGQFGRPDQGIFSYWINAHLRRRRLRYIGFGGTGRQVRDALDPVDLVPVLLKQMSADNRRRDPVSNFGGGINNSMSLAQLNEWCDDRFGKHGVDSDPQERPFDVPWLVMDSARAAEQWDFTVRTPLPEILAAIAEHARRHPEWLELSEANF